MIVDVVTSRTASLHNDLMARLNTPEETRRAADLYAVSYHPVKRGEDRQLDLWPETLAVGSVLPTLPLWLRGGISLPVNLEESYERTRQEQRVAVNGQ
jgi:hypothetical protein